MKEMMKFNNDEMSVVIYKSMEIYDTLKKTIIKVNSERLSIEDKKYLSLLLGILNTDNQNKDVEINKLLKENDIFRNKIMVLVYFLTLNHIQNVKKYILIILVIYLKEII